MFETALFVLHKRPESTSPNQFRHIVQGSGVIFPIAIGVCVSVYMFVYVCVCVCVGVCISMCMCMCACVYVCGGLTKAIAM